MDGVLFLEIMIALITLLSLRALWLMAMREDDRAQRRSELGHPLGWTAAELRRFPAPIASADVDSCDADAAPHQAGGAR